MFEKNPKRANDLSKTASQIDKKITAAEAKWMEASESLNKE